MYHELRRKTWSIRRWPCVLGVGLCLLHGTLSTPAKADPIIGSAPQAPVTDVDVPGVPVEAFVPKAARSEAESNRLRAEVLFAMARIKEQRGEMSSALRLYQRAARNDPASVAIVKRIVELAASQGRLNEAVRYAAQATDLDSSSVAWLAEVGAEMAKAGKTKDAIRFLKRAWELEPNAKSVRRVVLRFELGRLNYLAEEFAEASDCFAEVFTAFNSPADYGLTAQSQKALIDSPRTYELFGDAFVKANRADLARDAFQKVDKLDPNETRNAYYTARVAALNGDHAKAVELLEKYAAGKVARDGIAPYELYAKELTAAGKESELFPKLHALLDADPANVALRYFVGQRLHATGQLDEAESTLSPLARGEQTPAEVFPIMASIYLANKNVPRLLDVLGDVAKQTNSLELTDQVARGITENPEIFDQIVALARKRLEEGADSLSAGQRLAIALVALDAKKPEVSSEFFELALKANRENAAQIVLSWGIGMLLQERYAEAEKILRGGIDENLLPQGNPAFHFYLSGALELQGKTDEALTMAAKALEAPEPSPRIESRVPWILYHAKRYQESLASYQQLIQKYDEQFQSEAIRDLMRESRLAVSNLYVLLADLPKAEEMLEQVLDEFPDDPGAMNDLGYLWADQGKNLSTALEMVQKALASDPENFAYQDSVGWALHRLGRNEEAVQYLEKACKQESPDGVLLEHLADILAALGRQEEAKANWTKAIEALQKQGETQKIDVIRKKLDPNAAPAPASESPAKS